MGTLDFLEDGQFRPNEKIALCHEQSQQVVAKMTKIVNAAKSAHRDLTAAEVAEIESLESQAKTISAASDSAAQQARRDQLTNQMIDQRLADGRIDLSRPQSGLPDEGYGFTPQMQSDEHGRRYAVLNKQQRASDVFRPQCENGIGHYILGKLFGANRQTPASITNAMGENTGQAGGFLVPEQLSGEWIDLMRPKSSTMAAGATVVMMGSESMMIPTIEQDPTIATKAENTAFTPTELKIGAVNMVAHLGGAVVEMSRELAEDSRDIAARMVTQTLVRSLAAQVDKWGLQGTGSAEPLGILNDPDVTEVSSSVGGIDWLDASALAAAIRVSNHEPNAVIMHPTILQDMQEIVTGDASTSARNWLGRPPSLENVQFLDSTNCPLANMVAGDWSYYYMGVRTQPLVEVTTQAGDSFAKHQMWIKITSRFSFTVTDTSAFRYSSGITT